MGRSLFPFKENESEDLKDISVDVFMKNTAVMTAEVRGTKYSSKERIKQVLLLSFAKLRANYKISANL